MNLQNARFAARSELGALARRIIPDLCRWCLRAGNMRLHGYLRGYVLGGDSSKLEIRGRRVFCSDRRGAEGCGRTISILRSDLIARRFVTAGVLWLLLAICATSQAFAPAWAEVSGGLSRSTGYRLRCEIRRAQTHIRAALLSSALPPECDAPEPLAQLVAHLAAAAPPKECPVAAFQLRFQRSIFS